MRILGLVVFGIASAMLSLLALRGERPEDAQSMWGGSAFFGALWLYLFYLTRKGDKGLSEHERRAQVLPLSADFCVYCHRPLLAKPYPHGLMCDVRI